MLLESDQVESDNGLFDKSWPPKEIDETSSGTKEVRLLEVLLAMHGYSVIFDGIYAHNVTKKVRAFQKECGLPETGKVDHATWRKLMKLPIGY